MFSNKIRAALESIDYDIDNVVELTDMDEVLTKYNEIDEDDDVSEMQAQLNASIEELESLMNAKALVSTSMSTSKYNTIKKYLGEVPSMESYFETFHGWMFTESETDVGVKPSNESVLSAITNGIKYVIDKIIGMFKWIAKVVREYFFGTDKAYDQATKEMANNKPKLDKVNNIIKVEESAMTATPPPPPVDISKRIDENYISKLNSVWNNLYETHMTKRNLGALIADNVAGINSYMQTVKTHLVSIHENDLDSALGAIQAIENTSLPTSIVSYAKLMNSDFDFTDNLSNSEKIKFIHKEFTDAINTKVEFKHTLLDVNESFYNNLRDDKSILGSIRVLNKTIENKVDRLTSKLKSSTDEKTLKVVSGLAAIVTNITNLMSIHKILLSSNGKMINESNYYIKIKLEQVLRASMHPDTSAELKNKLQSV